MYIWQQDKWQHPIAPAFRWDEAVLRPLQAQISELQAHLLAPRGRPQVGHATADTSDTVLTDAQLNAARLDALLQNALRTSEIEGETLDAQSLRSSVVKQLGLDTAGLPTNTKASTPQTDALVTLLVEATTQHADPISVETLCRWQAALFTDPDPLFPVTVGALRGEAPMRVVSGRVDRPRVHFEAPPRAMLDEEIQRFVSWFNTPPKQLDPILRAGLTHFWLVTLHPFDDGNGRVTRALTDRALAQADATSIRYYSHSAAIMAKRNAYYRVLEASQRGTLDVTPWFEWFLCTLIEAMAQGQRRFERVLNKARFWQHHAQTVLNARQVGVLNRLLDTWGDEFVDGLKAGQYKALAKVSKATATRELADLLQKGCLIKLPGGGRSTRYTVGVVGNTSLEPE